MDLRMPMHAAYERLVETAARSHRQNRSPHGIAAEEVVLARLYCYAFRRHTIGAFHATRLAIERRPQPGPLAAAHRLRAVEALEDLANEAMLPVPRDFRAVICTFWRYHRGIGRVVESLACDHAESHDEEVLRVGERFAELMGAITASNGIVPVQDTDAPQQATFLVPNLGILIVPLVYGDYHSWNLAWLAGEARDAPTHRHHEGVEIHLGYHPTHGVTVLGDFRAQVDEGYAKPIPPETDHGWINTSGEIHHVPFIFGSLVLGGWGVFFDVEPATRPPEDRPLVARDSEPFRAMVYLERRIAEAEAKLGSWRVTLVPSSATERGPSGGLELNLTRIDSAGFPFPFDEFRIVSVVRGKGLARIAGIEQEVRAHDHFGIPAGLQATIRQQGPAPLVTLDALIRPAAAV